MRAHSIETRTPQVKTQQRLSSEAPEAYSSVCGFFPRTGQELKQALRRCESASTLAKRPKSSAHNNIQRLSQLQAKYKSLEDDYRQALLQVRDRNDNFCYQKNEIDKWTLNIEKQQKQIARLKQMLRLTEKNTIGTQTNPEVISAWRKRVQVSTGESQLTSETRCDRDSNRNRSQNKSRMAEPRKTAALIGSEKQKMSESRMQRTNGMNGMMGKERAPLSKKYKFVPTLNFRHH